MEHWFPELIVVSPSASDTKADTTTVYGRHVMDLVQAIQQQLHELRATRGELSGIDASLPPDAIANLMIADMMNMLETLFVMLNLPADGFVSLTSGSQQNVNTDEQASSG